MSTLYILKIADSGWYVGGGAAVIADTLDEVRPMLEARYNGSDSPSSFPLAVVTSEAEAARDASGGYVFVLVETFPVPPQPARLVMFSIHDG